MSVYMAELQSNGVVKRVIVAPDTAWPAQKLGGTWVQTSDPYLVGQTVTYCAREYGYDPTWPDRFAPIWRQPLEATTAYAVGVKVWHNGRIWENLTPANVWEPGVSGWRDSPLTGYPIWVQPTGAHDAYALGARVTHNGQNWESTTPANVWEPGVFGWVVV